MACGQLKSVTVECFQYELGYNLHNRAKKDPLTKERPPPTFCPITCIGSKFTLEEASYGV